MEYELGMIKADLEIRVIDKDGNVIFQKDGPSHSWTKNYYNYVLGQVTGIYGTTTLYGTELSKTSGGNLAEGTTANFGEYGGETMWANFDTNYHGCVVGTGTAAETFVSSTTALCGNGVGVDQFSYGNGNKLFYTSTAGTVLHCKHDRTFTNNSGNTINVTEAGLYGYISNNTSNNGTIMFNRDVFSVIPITVGNSMYVAYTLKLTLPQAIHT